MGNARSEQRPSLPACPPALALAYLVSQGDKSRDIGPLGPHRSLHSGRAQRHTHPRRAHSCHQRSQPDTVMGE